MKGTLNETHKRAAPGRNSATLQGTTDCHQATVCKNIDRKQDQLTIGTWNVKTMAQQGKLENVKKESDRLGVDIMGLSEMRWKRAGKIKSNKHMYYTRGMKKLLKMEMESSSMRK